MNITPSNDFTHLWNDMSREERDHLVPYHIESQILHIWQVKQVVIKNHKHHMKELDDWMKNLVHTLDGYRRELEN